MDDIREEQSVDDQRDWLVLDNAARIYPAAFSEWSPDVYRLSVTLKEPIRVSVLKQALQEVFPRFPYFQVHLQRGLFWYYLQRDDSIPELRPLSTVPVSLKPGPEGGAHLLRVQAGGNTIAVDFSHVLTDGTGAIRFIGTLVTQYLRRKGVHISNWEPFLDPEEPSSPSEFEDAYNKYFNRDLPGPQRLSSAYHLPDPARPCYRIITGKMPVDKMLDLSRNYGVSLTEYLVAVYMYSLAQVRSSTTDEGSVGGILRIEVPVDMRRFYPSQTMRNFSLYASPEIDLRLGTYSFDAIVKRVHHSMTLQVDRMELSRQISRNVRAQRNPFIRIIPLFLKDRLLLFIRKWLGERLYSGVLTNIGRIEVPKEILPHISEFGLMLGPNPWMKISCAVLSFQNDLKINFGSVIKSRETERLFFSHIAGEGVQVIVSERKSGL